jgi:hypothetical protein
MDKWCSMSLSTLQRHKSRNNATLLCVAYICVALNGHTQCSLPLSTLQRHKSRSNATLLCVAYTCVALNRHTQCSLPLSTLQRHKNRSNATVRASLDREAQVGPRLCVYVFACVCVCAWACAFVCTCGCICVLWTCDHLCICENCVRIQCSLCPCSSVCQRISFLCKLDLQTDPP